MPHKYHLNFESDECRAVPISDLYRSLWSIIDVLGIVSAQECSAQTHHVKLYLIMRFSLVTKSSLLYAIKPPWDQVRQFLLSQIPSNGFNLAVSRTNPRDYGQRRILVRRTNPWKICRYWGLLSFRITTYQGFSSPVSLVWF